MGGAIKPERLYRARRASPESGGQLSALRRRLAADLGAAPRFADLAAAADEGGRYALEERAAIHEHDGGLPRHEAERRAAEEHRL